MADTGIVQGLFGLSPNQVQQQQQANINQQAYTYGQSDPFQRAAQGMFQAGAGLGGLGAQGMGMVNPQVEEARQREAMMQGADTSSPEGLRALADRLSRAGMQQQAMMASAKANEIEAQLAKNAEQNSLANLHRVQATSAGTTDAQKNAAALADSSGAIRGSTEWIAAYKDNLTNLTDKSKQEKISQYAQPLLDSGLTQGSPEFNSAMKKYNEATLSKQNAPALKISMGGATEEKLTPAGMKLAGDMASKGIALPAGYGAKGISRANSILNAMAAEGTTASDIGAGKADREADTKALAALVKVNAGVNRAALKIENDIKTMQSLEQAGSLNMPAVASKPLNWARTQTGSPDLRAYALSVKQVATEYERLLSGGALSTAQLHQGAADDAKNLLNENMTIAESRAIVPVMLREIANSKQAGVTAENEIRDKLKGKKPADVAAPPAVGGKVRIKFDAQGNQVQ